MAEGSGVLSQGPTLAPHDAPNMLSLFMTQYDYDYHRTSAFGSTGGEASKAPGEDGDEMSGDVRNRPVDLHASTGEGLSNASVYTTDYTRRDSRFRGPVSALVAAASRPRNAQEWGTAFIRERHPPTSGPLRPSLDDVTTYREAYGPVDMNEFQHLQQVASRGEDDVEPYLHPGARASSYVHDFLYIDDTGSDPNASVAPKITSRESLLPKVATGNSHPRGGHDGKGESFGHRPVPRRPLNMFGGKGDYFCHSTLYGDSSLAHPTQLPRGVLDSSNAHLIPHIHDKAKLLTLLSGRGAHDARRQPVAESEWKTSSSQYDPSDDTNPVMMAQTELARSQVSRRLENEGFIKKTIYQSDFIDQKLLPELPNNTLGGAAAGADSLAGMAATSGATPLFSRSGCGGYAAADVEESLASGQARELAATINNAVYGGVIRARAAPNLRSSKSNSAGDSGWRHSRYSKQFVGAPGPRAASLSAALNSTSFLYPGQLPMPVRAGAGGGTAASSVAGMAQARLCAGDMLEGTLTKRAKEGELHRNSHGYLKDSRPHTVSAGEWAKLEDADLLARVDSRGDPHQQKMRALQVPRMMNPKWVTHQVDRIQIAHAHIQKACEQEHPDGNPLVAARHYIVAMEMVAAAVYDIPFADAAARRFFLYQLRTKMEPYYERAELLMQVAAEGNGSYLDRPTTVSGSGEFKVQLPPVPAYRPAPIASDTLSAVKTNVQSNSSDTPIRHPGSSDLGDSSVCMSKETSGAWLGEGVKGLAHVITLSSEGQLDSLNGQGADEDAALWSAQQRRLSHRGVRTDCSAETPVGKDEISSLERPARSSSSCSPADMNAQRQLSKEFFAGKLSPDDETAAKCQVPQHNITSSARTKSPQSDDGSGGPAAATLGAAAVAVVVDDHEFACDPCKGALHHEELASCPSSGDGGNDMHWPEGATEPSEAEELSEAGALGQVDRCMFSEIEVDGGCVPMETYFSVRPSLPRPPPISRLTIEEEIHEFFI